MEEDKSSFDSKIHDHLGFLSESLGFRQKRSSRPVLKRDKIDAEVNTREQEMETIDSAADEDEIDHDEESTMLESLNELAASSKHQITRTENRYICMFCNIKFPTFHAAGVHVSETIGTDAISVVKAGAAEGSDGSRSVNQGVEASGNCRQLEFDLNELPPMVDDEEA